MILKGTTNLYNSTTGHVSGDVRKYPDFVVQNGFSLPRRGLDINNLIFTVAFLGHIYTWEAETWCASLLHRYHQPCKV